MYIGIRNLSIFLVKNILGFIEVIKNAKCHGCFCNLHPSEAKCSIILVKSEHFPNKKYTGCLSSW
jgi:hypothetical protein